MEAALFVVVHCVDMMWKSMDKLEESEDECLWTLEAGEVGTAGTDAVVFSLKESYDGWIGSKEGIFWSHLDQRVASVLCKVGICASSVTSWIYALFSKLNVLYNGQKRTYMQSVASEAVIRFNTDRNRQEDFEHL